MRKTATWNRLLATTVITGMASLAFAAPAYAQPETDEDVPVDSPATTMSGEAPELEEQDGGVATEGTAGTTITVTGSRIARPDLTAPSPVTVVDDEQVSLTGTTTVETLLNDLPQVIPGNNRTSNNAGGFPFATLDLRGLGPGRTLILVDGERIPPSSSSGVVDISQVPVGLIERIDVVTGGASAVYGSDAMAGVVNFILKQDYEGLELTGQMGIADPGVGFNYNVSGLFGGNFADGRGNMTIYASYFDRVGVKQDRFAYSRTSAAIFYDPADNRVFVVDDPSDAIAGSFNVFSGGSITPPWGIISNNAANPFTGLSTAVGGEFVGQDTDCNPATAGTNVNGGNLTFDPTTGALQPYTSAGFCAIPIGNSSRYNYAPANFLTIPYDRFNLSSTARYDFSDRTTGRLFASFTNSNSRVELAPTPAFAGTGFTIDPTTAQFIPAQLQTALDTRPNPDATFAFGRRFAETGPRIGTTESQAIIGRATVEHELSADWRIAAGLGWGRTDVTSYNVGNINRVAVEQGVNGCRNAAGVVNGPGVLPGCVPVNIFGANTINDEMLAFIQTDTTDVSEFEQVRASVNVSGTTFELPGGPIGLAFGAEVRTDRGQDIVDDAKQRGEIIGFNAQESIRGQITVKEAYGEIRLPLLGGRGGFPDLLAVEFGARYSDYSTVGGLFNWKAAAEFAPVNWLRFRGSYNKAARAPNIFELFRAGDQGFPSYVDPCNDPPGAATLPADVAARCIAEGVPAAALPGFQQSNSQVQAFAFGQPDLEEEKAETFTLGAVLTPDWFPLGRMSLTVDYYDIEITNRVSALGAGFYLNQCYNQGVATACDRIVRDPGTGQVTRIDTGLTNSDVPLTARGIDVGFNWVIPMGDFLGGTLGDGRLRISELFSYTLDFKYGDQDFVDTVGFNQGIGYVPISKYTSTLTVGYELEDFVGQVRWVYKTGGEQGDAAFGNAVNHDRVPDLSFVDLSLRWQPSERFEFTGIVSNIFNKFPRQTVTGVFEQANTNAAFFSPIALGRAYTFQAKVRF